MSDIHHMRHALGLAERGLGRVTPNPAVGCVIVSGEGRVVGRGWTQASGRPHAETVALAQAGEVARGATAYVTLEPCAHHGQTPPCAEALIAAGVERVVAAVEDHDPRVSGKGLAMLRAAGIAVETGVCAKEAAALNAGFFLRVREGRPLVTLKAAMSLDGKIAAASGESQWITGEEARRYGHLLRAKHDAILVGIGTALADDPELTCRIAGLEDRSPLRVVLDSALRLPLESKLVRGARAVPVLVFTINLHHRPHAAATDYAGDPFALADKRKMDGPDGLYAGATDGHNGMWKEEKMKAFQSAGVEVIAVTPDALGRPDVKGVANALAQRGITRLLVEGGAGVHGAFLDAGLADRLEIFRAPILLGSNGVAGVAALSSIALASAPRFTRSITRQLGADLLESYSATG